MKYKFLSLEESGNGTDFIMAVQRQPNLWQRLAGQTAEEIEFFGHPPHWSAMDGLAASRQVEQVLNEFWETHTPKHFERTGAAAWKGLEPNAQ